MNVMDIKTEPNSEEISPLSDGFIDQSQANQVIVQGSFHRKTIKNHFFSYLVVLFLIIGAVASLIFLSQNQDNRQQAFGGDPYTNPSTDPSVFPDIEHRPETKETCKTAGVWIGKKCYLYWEMLPEGTHMVVPGAYNSYGYEALIPIEKAKEILEIVNGNLPSPTPTTTQKVSKAPSDQEEKDSVVVCDLGFKLIGGICVPDQKSPSWNSDWINRYGCGAMQALYYAMQLNPNLDADEFVEKYYNSYTSGAKQGNTYDSENIKVLEDLGYAVEPYTKSIIANGYKEIDNNGTFFVKGVFAGGVNHYFSISNIYTDENGRTILNTVDSYYNIDKCIASAGNKMNCYDADNKLVTSIDLSDPETSIYLVI